jgi:hypothetical protein
MGWALGCFRYQVLLSIYLIHNSTSSTLSRQRALGSTSFLYISRGIIHGTGDSHQNSIPWI